MLSITQLLPLRIFKTKALPCPSLRKRKRGGTRRLTALKMEWLLKNNRKVQHQMIKINNSRRMNSRLYSRGRLPMGCLSKKSKALSKRKTWRLATQRCQTLSKRRRTYVNKQKRKGKTKSKRHLSRASNRIFRLWHLIKRLKALKWRKLPELALIVTSNRSQSHLQE